MRFMLGDETAISRYFSRNRQRRGLDALSSSMLALAGNEPTLAARKAAKAEKLLRRPEITDLVRAQAAEMNGETDKACELYKSMLENDRTRFIAVHGLMRHKLEAGDRDTALALAKKASALRPTHGPVLNTLFELQSRSEDWSGARETLNAKLHARMLPRDVGARAATRCSRSPMRVQGDRRRQHARGTRGRDCRRTSSPRRWCPPRRWPREAHGDEGLQAAGDVRPDQGMGGEPASRHRRRLRRAGARTSRRPLARRRRFDTLNAAAPEHVEEQAPVGRTGPCRRGLPGGAQGTGRPGGRREPTTRSLTLMAAVERGLGAPEVRRCAAGWPRR
jgi:HemY protein